MTSRSNASAELHDQDLAEAVRPYYRGLSAIMPPEGHPDYPRPRSAFITPSYDVTFGISFGLPHFR
jgi:hypothetical protein